ncbi:hypothetical protein Tco_0784863 [Tanacetum coccineum]
MSDEPLGDDSKPISYDVTFSNPLFDFNDDSTLCNGNPLFDEEFEDISSLDPPELTLVIDESTLLVTLSLLCTDVLGDVIIDIDLPLGEPLDILSTEDREINFNPSRDIEELERLLADDPVPVPRVFDDPLGFPMILKTFVLVFNPPIVKTINISRVLRIILVILPEHPSDTNHNGRRKSCA